MCPLSIVCCEESCTWVSYLSPSFFTWYQSLVRGEELRQQAKARGDRETLVRGSASPFSWAFGSILVQVHSRECKVQNLRLRRRSLWSTRALLGKIELRGSFCRENFHSETVLASRSFSRHSGEVAVFDCVCRIFACVRFVTDRLLCDTGAEILRNAGQFGLLCLCIFVTWSD